LLPEGTGYRARTRLAKFHNLPELLAEFRDFADIQTADMLDLPTPDVNYVNIILEPSEIQQDMVQKLSERAALVQTGKVDPKDDNMLKITTDGRKIGLDQRLMNPLLPESENSKTNACADKVFDIWDDTKDKRLTQLVFCDFSTPKKDGRFNIYEDIKDKLIEKGIPEHEIAFIHDYESEARKKELFAKVRKGKVRVLFGSTAKMGAGTNVQDKLIATHDADCPWRPADLEQRAGRIVRQGNDNPEVSIFRYATKGTFDSYLWQTVEAKQKFIAQIMTSKSPVRSCEDIDETALSFAEIKALCAGNPLIAEKMNLDVEVARLRMIKADYQSQKFRLEDDIMQRYPKQITALNEHIAGIEKDVILYREENVKGVDIQEGIGGSASVTAKFHGMTIKGVTYSEKEPAGKALLEICKTIPAKEEVNIGNYMGFNMSLRYESMSQNFVLSLRGSMTYQVDLGTDTFGNITRINNVLADLPKKLEDIKSRLDTAISQVEAAKIELAKPFTLADELLVKETRLMKHNAELNIGSDGSVAQTTLDIHSAHDRYGLQEANGHDINGGAVHDQSDNSPYDHGLDRYGKDHDCYDGYDEFDESDENFDAEAVYGDGSGAAYEDEADAYGGDDNIAYDGKQNDNNCNAFNHPDDIYNRNPKSNESAALTSKPMTNTGLPSFLAKVPKSVLVNQSGAESKEVKELAEVDI